MELKQEVLTLIAEIPAEKSDVFIKILKTVRELIGVDSTLRAEKNLAIMNEMRELIGDDVPWANEEEMIRELAEMRRRNSKS